MFSLVRVLVAVFLRNTLLKVYVFSEIRSFFCLGRSFAKPIIYPGAVPTSVSPTIVKTRVSAAPVADGKTFVFFIILVAIEY